ncbi:MAG: hypothetical protein C5B45_06695 [Chlamydiae bacterium]|nr:MAG: hypothetical protein C5B45_06695 [Chlamydiota bacterium]
MVVGDLENPQEILVSRKILVQKSRYFHMLFQPNFLESSKTAVVLTGLDHTAKPQGIDYEGFLYLLRYTYTGKTHVPLDLCPIVSHLADMYLEPYLKYACDHTIKKLLKQAQPLPNGSVLPMILILANIVKFQFGISNSFFNL